MGLFSFLKKDKKIKCEKCGKEKLESEGNYILNGSTFCCKQCCNENKKNDGEKNVCKFC